MSTSVTYVYSTDNNFRAEVIQVDNTAAAVNVSVNLQVKTSYIDANHLYFAGQGATITGWYIGGSLAFTHSIRITTEPSSSGTWTGICNQWCATLSRANSNGFEISCYAVAKDEHEVSYSLAIEHAQVVFKGYVPDDVQDNVTSTLTATLGTSKTFTISNGGSYAAHTDILEYSFNGSSWTTISNSISVASGGAGSVNYTFPASVGSNFLTTTSGTCTLRLTTKAGSTTIGTRTYTMTLSVPNYSYTALVATASKVNYTTIGTASDPANVVYVASKHKVRFAVPALPSAQYGATVTGTFDIYYTGGPVLDTKPITSATNVDFVGQSVGTLVGSYTIRDSRGKTSNGTVSVHYIANPRTQVVFTAQRDGSSTTVNLNSGGTYDHTISGNTGTLTLYKGTTTITSASGSSGTASITTTDTLATSASATYKAVMTDGLGNTATLEKTVSTAFAYLQIGTGAGRGVSIGRYGTIGGNVNRLEVGLETSIPRFFPYMETDSDGHTMLSAWEVFLPRITRSTLGLTDNSIGPALEAYLKWVVKNISSGATRTRGLYQVGNMYAIDVEIYERTVNADGTPQYSAGIAYTYGKANAAYRFGTHNYEFYYHPLDVISQFMVQKAYLTTDTNNVEHSPDSVVMAPHVGYADLGLTTSSTMVEEFKALTNWLKTNYASNTNIQKSRCIVHGTFAGLSNGSTDRNMMYQVMFYDLSQAESSGTAPRYCCGWAMMLNSLKLFTFRNNNGTFNVHEFVGTNVTA